MSYGFIYIHPYIYISLCCVDSRELQDSLLAIHPYHPLLLVGLLGYVLCQHKVDVCKSLLVGQHWHVHV